MNSSNDIRRMAREAGFANSSFCRWSAYTDDLERFAALVAAAEREWVGLTDEEVKDIVWNLPYEPSQEHIRAIEAKLKEKNT